MTTTADLGVFSVQRLASEWGVHEDTLRAIIRRGELPTIRIGRQVRIRRSDAIAFLDAAAEVPAPPRL